MSDAPTVRADVRDMYSVHEAFRRGLREAKPEIRAVEGDVEGATRFTEYFGDLLWLLHAHHDGEDELLYPLLVERVPLARTHRRDGCSASRRERRVERVCRGQSGVRPEPREGTARHSVPPATRSLRRWKGTSLKKRPTSCPWWLSG
ncbi:MAG: hemerythrin domain-containing protein [Acidimicrobiales bacterium]